MNVYNNYTITELENLGINTIILFDSLLYIYENVQENHHGRSGNILHK